MGIIWVKAMSRTMLIGTNNLYHWLTLTVAGSHMVSAKQNLLTFLSHFSTDQAEI